MSQSAPVSKGAPGGLPGRQRDPRALSAWLLVGVFACVVLWLGTPDFSATHSYGWLLDILRFFVPDVGPGTVIWLHRLIRKGAHLFVYAVLGLLAFRAAWFSFGTLLIRVTLTAIVVAVGVALIDEARQSTFATRTGSPYDVVIDALGAICAVGMAAFLVRRRLAQRKERATP